MGEKRKIKVKKVESKEGIIKVSRTILNKGEVEKISEEEKRLEIRPFITATANVSVKTGATFPLSVPYSSARIDIMLSVPCYVEEMVEVFEQTKDLVAELMDEEVRKIKLEEPEDESEEIADLIGK